MPIGNATMTSYWTRVETTGSLERRYIRYTVVYRLVDFVTYRKPSARHFLFLSSK
jgi:hypothetical protein